MASTAETIIESPPQVVHLPRPSAQIIGDTLELCTVSNALAISTPEQYRQAGEQLRAIKARQKAVEAERTEILRPMNDAAKAVRAFFERPLAMLADSESVLKRGILAYDARVAAERREAERVAAEAARKERERLEREAAAAREKARREREAAEAKARELEAQGRAEKAEAMRQAAAEKEAQRQQAAQIKTDAAASIPAQPVVHMEAPKVAGQTRRTIWKWRLQDRAAVPAEYLMLDETAIGKVVRALGERTSIPGIEVYPETTLAAGSR